LLRAAVADTVSIVEELEEEKRYVVKVLSRVSAKCPLRLSSRERCT
jgi:hypothetical protein